MRAGGRKAKQSRKQKPITFIQLLQNTLIAIGRPILLGSTFSIITITLSVEAFFDLLKRALRKRKAIRVHIRPSVKFFAFLGVLILLSSLITVTYILQDLPRPGDLVSRDIEVSTKIYDRNGLLLYKIYKDKNRTLIQLETIPLHVRLAVLAAEDAEFYNHIGFSIRGMTRSSIKYLKKGDITSGSTITQQLVKNALLSPEKTLSRKIREIVLAIEVERTYSKDQILEMYLNEVPFGGTAYGIHEAAQFYFGKNVDTLTLAEAALLAGLPKSPTKLSPFGPEPELALARQKEILTLMEEQGFITPEQHQEAQNEKLEFVQNKLDIKAPHFVMYIKQLLVEKYGEEMVEKGGLEVYTTLDYSIQEMAQKAVTEEVERLKKLNVGNGAALVINPQTGEILAMVGSKDYFDTAAQGNVNVTLRERQPGSSIKIVNYAYALSNNYTPATIIEDSPVTFSVRGQKPYSPKNYDGKYRGRLTLRNAFAESRNIPAVRVLASYGVDKMLDMGTKMGITTWQNRSRYGLSLTLGGGEVKLIDLAGVYATVANYGKKTNLKSINRIVDAQGKQIFSQGCSAHKEDKFSKFSLLPVAWASESSIECEAEEVISPKVAFLLIDMLKDNIARSPAFGSNSALVIPKHPEVAVKTGTSNDLKDNLTIGFNPEYLVAVWVGNNNSSPMSRIASGVTGAAPIWNRIMTQLLADTPSKEWSPPPGVVQLAICSLTGTLPCEGCPVRTEWFLEESKPNACNFTQMIAHKKKQ